MTIHTGQITVVDVPHIVDGISTNPIRLHVHNNSNTKNLLLGNSDLTISNGMILPAGDSIELTLNPLESLYIMSTDTNPHQVSYLSQTV